MLSCLRNKAIDRRLSEVQHALCSSKGGDFFVKMGQQESLLQVVRQWAAISFGEGHAAGVSGEGEVFTWGKNDLGQVGQNVGHDKHVPTKMEILKGWDVRALACGAHHTVALTPEDVISWGANSEGQCGQGERAETLWVKPRSIKPLQGMYVSQVVCGKYHTLCVTATSQVPDTSFSSGNRYLLWHHACSLDCAMLKCPSYCRHPYLKPLCACIVKTKEHIKEHQLSQFQTVAPGLQRHDPVQLVQSSPAWPQPAGNVLVQQCLCHGSNPRQSSPLLALRKLAACAVLS